MIKTLLIVYSFIFLTSINSLYAAENLQIFLKDKWVLSKTNLNYLDNGKVLAESKVTSKDNYQTFDLKAAAYHKKPCQRVLRKLSMLESYQDWISFIESSTYNEKRNLYTLVAKHTLLPYDMIVHIIVKRPTKEGKYPFTFPTGLFSGLKGHFKIESVNNRCALFATSHWHGRKTAIPNLVVEVFTQTLARLGGEIIMRKTQ